jgi:hypothetical protein
MLMESPFVRRVQMLTLLVTMGHSVAAALVLVMGTGWNSRL